MRKSSDPFRASDRLLGHQEEVIMQYQGKPIRVKTTKHYPPDPTSMIFYLKNRRPDRWRDKQELAGSLALSALRPIMLPDNGMNAPYED